MPIYGVEEIGLAVEVGFYKSEWSTHANRLNDGQS